MLREKSLEYQTICFCRYRSDITRLHATVGDIPHGSATLFKRVTKACFNQAPTLPKYSDMWDVDKLMGFLETLYPNTSLSTYDLGMKTVALISSLSISRQSSVAGLAPQFQLLDNNVVIPLAKLEKTPCCNVSCRNLHTQLQSNLSTVCFSF